MTKKEKQNTLTTTTINIQDLKPAEYNPRIMPPSEQLKLKTGLETFGLVDPIIIDLTDENTVIGGHQRLEVLREINPEQELTLIPLGDIGLIIRETDLKIKDKNDQKALNLALNKIQGDWDYKKLDDLLLELSEDYYQIELTGFGDEDLELEFDDLDDLLPDGNEFPSDEEVINQQEQPENNKEAPSETPYTPLKEVKVIVKEGDKYQLGNHVLLCADSSERENIEKLLSGEQVDLLLTDPPYGIDVVSTNSTERERESI